MAYIFSFWTWYALYEEYKIVAKMRLHFIAGEGRRADQYTVSTNFLYCRFECPWVYEIMSRHKLYVAGS